MSVPIAEMYQVLSSTIAAGLAELGFKVRGSQEFVRSSDKLFQRLAISLHELPGQDAGYVEEFPGFNFPEVESLAASLQGKKPRAGFITCSLNIGLLTPKGTTLEWPLSPQEDIASLARKMSQAIIDFAVPFWDEFSTLDKLLARLQGGDFRVCRGSEWPWRQAAVFCLLGQPQKAADFLQGRLVRASATETSIIEGALGKIARLSNR